MRDEAEISDDDDDYEKIDDNLWAGDEEDVYKVPRNVVSCGGNSVTSCDVLVMVYLSILTATARQPLPPWL